MLPPVPEGHTRLFRLDNTRRQKHRPVEGLSGRWFSDDPSYIEAHYAHEDTVWTYIDIPRETAEQYRYECVSRTDDGRHLYGVEGKDFVLPPNVADQRIRIDRPDEYIKPAESTLPKITEITSNVAVIGRVLHYNGGTGDVVVVEEVRETEAVVLTKNRKRSKEEYTRITVPIRKVKRL